ncbi:LysR substrate-binding domain-containing protein [Castellaniella caeni]|uniref:LysR substrate-binding domain-containing protein n=1 Tax=Castellaniella caeni TaxID=266123 RepID=UPI0008363714|nr:LysR substrate-binding domain-containing protein [Castellaniella caeni]
MQDLDDLAYFALVVEHGGFAAAARASGIPKSKLSRRLAELETRLGVRLAQRSTRHFVLTPVGEQIVPHAHAMLAEAETVRALAHEQTHEPRGRVRLACPPALLQATVGPLLNAFVKAWPQVQLQIEASNRNVDVWQDGVDLVLRVRAPDAVLPQDEVVRPLAPSEHVLAVAPALLAGIPPLSAPDDLRALPTLGLGNSPEARAWHLRHADGRQVEYKHAPRLVADDMGVLLCAALDGVGCAVLPRLMLHDALASDQLRVVLPDWAPPPGVVQLAYASRSGQRAAVRKLIDYLADGFA